MGDLEIDTRVESVGDGRYTAKLSEDWRIWGPNGGYVASVALRAAGAASPFDRPSSISCHYLSVADFDTVDLEVITLRQARTALSQRVTMSQGDKAILEAIVWSIGEVEGLEHDVSEAPVVPGPDDLLPIDELLSEEEKANRPRHGFWSNFTTKPVEFQRPWPPAGPVAPIWQQWQRFEPTATFDDQWVDACRSVVLIDFMSWPTASRPHAHANPEFIAPTLDLYVGFHDPQPGAEWLLADGDAPVACHGLMMWRGRVWSPDRQLIASGTGQQLCRRVPRP